MRIERVEPASIAQDLGLGPGDELLEINGHRVQDGIDLRFHEHDEQITLKVARDGEVTLYDIEKEHGESLGVELEEMKVLACGNDCIFCFVDQNPSGLREQLYFRDGDYRMSFMYGNYTTMTNAGPAILRRIIHQRLSPQYISVHVTDYEIRRKLMGLKKDDRILEKIALLCDNGIDLHTQIVLCPGINDGEVLEKTFMDLYRYRERVRSLAIVPVGLTDHRMGLHQLRKVDADDARDLLTKVEAWQSACRREINRGFIYASDEFYILAGRAIPPAKSYDGFPQLENGVGMVRHFLLDFRRQARGFARNLRPRRRLTLVTAELAAGVLSAHVLPRLKRVAGLEPVLEVVPNTLYGRSVTVAGLLSANCIYSALSGKVPGDLVLLPPDVLNADGLFLDNASIEHLEQKLGAPVMVFRGRWADVFARLRHTPERRAATTTERG